MLHQLREKSLKEIAQAKDLRQLEEIYRQYLGRKGELTKVLRSLKEMSEKERKNKGRLANQIKKEIDAAIKSKAEKLFGQAKLVKERGWIDVSAPGIPPLEGHSHPISLIQRQVEDIFQSMGFSVVDGPEVETEYYNFDALNIPKDHPARDLWNTFWLKDINNLLLRTHTSPVQARYMEKHQPPLRIIVPGRCFRHEATDASHDVQFYQIEGLMVGQNISVVHFKGIVEEFLKKLFGPKVKTRLRPSYFPFTEPSFEVDIMGSFDQPGPDAAERKKLGKWVEVMGAGMVHQNVFKAVGYPLRKWQGFAFGLGLERLAMLKYKIDDIRLFYSGDLRFLKQF